jgi:hypothetical protein
MGRIEFEDWGEFMQYVKKIGHDRVMIYITEASDVIMRPSVQSRIDSAYFEKATELQIKELESFVDASNVFMIASFDWEEDRKR